MKQDGQKTFLSKFVKNYKLKIGNF